MRAISSRRLVEAPASNDAGRRRACPCRARSLLMTKVLIGARGHLRRMCDRDHLHAPAEPRQALADGVRNRAADAGIDLVEDQRRRRAAIGQHHFQRQQETRELAAGGDLHHRARPGAGIGLHPELDPVDAVRACGPCRRRTDSVVNFARSSLSGGSSLFTAPSSAVGGFLARGRERRGAASVTLARLPAPPSPAPRAVRHRHRSARDRRNFSGQARSGHRPANCTCGRGRAARTAAPRCARVRRIVVGDAPAPVRDGWRASSSAVRAASSAFTTGSTRRGRLRRRAAPAGGSRRRAPASATCRRPPPHAPRADPRRPSPHRIMPVRRSAEGGLLARLRRELVQFLDRVAQPVGLAQRPLHIGAMLATAACARRAARSTATDLVSFILEPAEGIEQPAMRRRIHQRAVVMLAVDLHQRRAEALQHLHAHRLIVDEGAGAAVAPIARGAGSDASSAGMSFVGEHRARRMPGRQLERRRSRCPAPRPAAPAPASPRPPSASAKASSRMDLPAPVSPVSTDRPDGEIDIEPVDQNDVADGKPGKHADAVTVALILTGPPRPVKSGTTPRHVGVRPAASRPPV